MTEKIEIIKGNLFDYPGALAHGVNCAGAMGKGIAVKFKNRWPQMYEEYKERCKKGLLIPGSCWTWEEPSDIKLDKNLRLAETGIYIFNLAIKAHWNMPASYVATRGAFKNLLREMQEKEIKEVAMPWIGCGLGGLQKNVVYNLLKKITEDTNAKFLVYEL